MHHVIVKRFVALLVSLLIAAVIIFAFVVTP